MSTQISIIIPILNDLNELKNNFDYLHALSHSKLELIFVDGGSTDGTWEYLKEEFDNVCQSDPGRAHQMNKGSEIANGEILIFHHVDSRLNNIGEIYSQFNASFKWGFFYIKLTGKHPIYRLIESSIRFRSRLFDVATGDQALFFKKKFFDEIGGFPSLELMEDISISRVARVYARPLMLKCMVTTSSRSWERHGAIKMMFFMWYLQVLFKLGMSSATINRLYRSRKWI